MQPISRCSPLLSFVYLPRRGAYQPHRLKDADITALLGCSSFLIRPSLGLTRAVAGAVGFAGCLLTTSTDPTLILPYSPLCNHLMFVFVPAGVCVLAPQGAYRPHQLKNADITCSSLTELSVINLRRMFANMGHEHMDLMVGWLGLGFSLRLTPNT